MDKQKHIWIVNYYTAPPEYTSNPRHIKFAEHMLTKGYKVTNVSAGYLRKQKLDLVPNKKKFHYTKYGKLDFLHVKVPRNTGNSIMRMFSIFLFALRLYYNRRKFEKPDIIVHNIHAPFDYYICKLAKKLKITYIAEAWDLWPQAFVNSGLINEKNIFLPLLFRFERKMYEYANKIIFSMEGGYQYIIDKKWDTGNGGKIDINKVYYINNGIDLRLFEQDKINYIIKDVDLEDKSTFKVLFVGGLRLGTNIKLLIKAAEHLKEHSDIKFYIYGDGAEREEAELYIKQNQVINVKLKEKWLEYKYLPYILSKSSLNILNYGKNNRGKYGVSPSKLGLYLASGKPIISNNKFNFCIIEKNHLGFSDNINTSEEYAKRILNIKNLSMQDYLEMCERVKKESKEFDYKYLSTIFENVINSSLKEQ